MRVLSPRIEPPRALDGSTASTATLCPPWSTRWRPNASMNVDLPTPGAADPDAHRAAGAGARRRAEAAALGLVIGAGRLDQRDGPRQRAPIPGDRPARGGERVDRRRLGSAAGRAVSSRSRAPAPRDVRARAEDRGHAGVEQEGVVLRRDDTPPTTRMSSPPGLRSSGDELGHERLVAGGLARHADDVHVVLDRVRAPPPRASGTAGRRRRRSRGRRTRWRSPWRPGRGRPGPS